MKIAFDAKRALNNSSGLGNYSRNLLNALMQNFSNEEYFLFSPQVKDDFFHQLTGEFKMIFPETKLQKSAHPLWRSYGIKNQVLKNGIDIYHGLSSEIPFGMAQLHTRTIVTIHDLIFLKQVEQYPFVDRKIYALKTKYAAKHAHKIVAISNETKQDLVELLGVKEEKVDVIYPIVSSAFQKKTEADIQKYKLPRKYILNVGSFFPRKNQRTLIEAFDLIKQEIEEDLVLVGGAGNMKEELMALIEKKKLNARVRIISNATNEDMPAIYSGASVFVWPSLYEGFGMPIVEALFSMVPVITTKGGCFEEAGGKNSLYINPLSAEEIAASIKQSLNNDSDKQKRVRAGLEHAQTMSQQRIAELTMRLYREQMGK